MRPAQYAKIYRWFAARPPALKALRLANRWLPLVSAGAYAVLLAGLAAGVPNRSSLWGNLITER